MSITQVIDYKVRPPKGAEGFFYYAMAWIVIIAVFSFILLLPLFPALTDSSNSSGTLLPWGILDKVSAKEVGVGFVCGIILFGISFIAECRKPKKAGLFSALTLILGAFVIAASFAAVILKSLGWCLDWLGQNGWLNAAAERTSPYILWYYIVLGVICGVCYLCWFTLVRLRERREGINRLQGNIFRKAWQFTVGDALAVTDCPVRDDLCMERTMYRFGLFLRAMVFFLCLSFLPLAIDIAVRLVVP